MERLGKVGSVVQEQITFAAFVHVDGGLSPGDLRRQRWVAKNPVLEMGNGSIQRTMRRSSGAPWFMTLFGRDSLWASEMALPIDPSLGLGTLQTLADRQSQPRSSRRAPAYPTPGQ